MRKILISAVLAVMAIGTWAGPVDEAKSLYNKGEYELAREKAQVAVNKSPRDGSANYWLGASLVALGRTDDAIAPLKKAESRGVAAAALALAEIAANDYRPSEAREWYDSYTELMRKAKKTIPNEVEDAQSRLVLMENMLDRVERITVIDSLIVDTDMFFKHYKLSPEAGRLVEGSAVLMPDVEMAFVPQNHTEIIYSKPDSTGTFVLMGADILDDGSVDHPAKLPGEDLGNGGNAEYPYMLSDGLTLYYASDGEGSIGGYDIFLTRRNEDGFLQPQNIGMPYNSPYDDYLLAIDETTGIGWWATDRNQIPGKVTIYVFVPEENRVNVSDDDPNLTALARMSDITLTQKPGADYTKLIDKINNLSSDTASSNNTKSFTGSFALPIGSLNKVYTKLSDFKSKAAREAMIQAINCRAEIEQLQNSLAELRKKYAAGGKNEGVNILNMEHNLDDARVRLNKYINTAIAEETSN